MATTTPAKYVVIHEGTLDAWRVFERSVPRRTTAVGTSEAEEGVCYTPYGAEFGRYSDAAAFIQLLLASEEPGDGG